MFFFTSLLTASVGQSTPPSVVSESASPVPETAAAPGVPVMDDDLDELCDYHKLQNKNSRWKTVIPEGESPYVFYDSPVTEPVVLISAPHSHRTFRYNEGSDQTHASESRLGAIVQLVSEITGVPGIRKDRKSDDPNYYDIIPDGTLSPGFVPGDELSYLSKIRDYVAEHPSIKVVLDLHGSAKVGKSGEEPANWAVDIGTGRADGAGDGSFQGADGLGPQAHAVAANAFEANGLHASDNRVYAGCCGQLTVTRFAALELGLDALQFEIAKQYRGCYQSQREELQATIQSIVDTIAGLNELYSTANSLNAPQN